MLEFKKPVLADKKWVDALLRNSSKGCEFCFGNIFIWSDIYNTEIASFNNTLVLRYKVDGEYSYSFSDSENLFALIELLFENSKKHSQALRIYGLSKNEKELLEKLFPDTFEFSEMRDFFDYVYKTEDLINLSGRKYHQKRNHISYLKSNNSWEYESINDSNIEECRLFNSQWERHNGGKNPEELSDENKAIQLALDNFSELGFTGGILRVNGKIEAYTLGERMNDEMFCTHIEKANADLRGAYPLINQQFAENELSSYKYVNREEDTGSEGLRQAKMSYHPAFLMESYFARALK
ncbi:MAG: phosphatidylglycerol lysyltransferase domain-containing protein [Clostridiales bacterium]|nr:phosphatidylglycerol lysyltransferase domain-containing protein [Clostridiales bacterium]